MDDSKNITFSFIVPVYNAQGGLERFYDELVATADGLAEPFEIIFVNDGSDDDTSAICRRLADRDLRVRVIELSRSFGSQAAAAAGHDFASGRAAISLAGDGQRRLEIIPQLVARWREGFEVVHAVRKGAPQAGGSSGALGRVMCRLAPCSSATDLADGAEFRLMDRKVVEAWRRTREQTRMVRGLVQWLGFRQATVSYDAGPRGDVQGEHSVKRRAGVNGGFLFLPRLLRLVPKVGAVMLVSSIVYAAASLALWPMGISAGPVVHLIMAIVGLFGLQFVFIGIVGEYVGRIFEQVNARPLYVVRGTVGFPVETKKEDTGAVESYARDKDNPVTIFT